MHQRMVRTWPLLVRRCPTTAARPACPPHDVLSAARRSRRGCWPALVHGKLKKSDSIKSMFWRLQMKTGINDGRDFYCLRRTGATMIEQIDPAATEM